MVVIYARISQDAAQEGKGIERQEFECRELAETRGFEVSKVYVDNNKSATKGTRPAFERMLRERPDGIIVWAQDRLARQPKDLERVIDLGVNIYTVQAGDLDLSSPHLRAVARSMVAWAIAEVEHKSERHKTANRQRVRDGLPLPGKRRYGFVSGNRAPRHDEAEVVRELFTSFSEGETIYGLAKSLTARGEPFRDNLTPWTPRRVRDILMNPAYYGCVVSKEVVIESKQVEAIVSKELWQVVHAILKDPSRKTSPGPARRHLLSGIARCGSCGGSMRVTSQSYYCKTPRKGHAVISKGALESLVLKAVENAIMFAPKRLLRIADEKDLTPLIKRLDEIDRGQLALLENISNFPQEMHSDAATKLAEKRKEVENEIAAVRASQSGLSTLAELAGQAVVLTGDRKTSLTVAGQRFAESRPRIQGAFSKFSIDRRREVIEGLLEVKVLPGRNNDKRVLIHHKIATGLND